MVFLWGNWRRDHKTLKAVYNTTYPISFADMPTPYAITF